MFPFLLPVCLPFVGLFICCLFINLGTGFHCVLAGLKLRPTCLCLSSARVQGVYPTPSLLEIIPLKIQEMRLELQLSGRVLASSSRSGRGRNISSRNPDH